MKFIILLSILFHLINCAPQADLVDLKQISQFPQNYEHKWYAGYLKASLPGNSIYYNFYESQNDPIHDPVLLWLQGGPGCSGLFGAFNENGPFQFYPSSKKAFLSDFAWNKNANLLFIESPAGVGFSFAKKQESNDDSAAEDNLAAVLDFFSKYPEYSKNEFFISGESYAGIYAPYLATYILRSNEQLKHDNQQQKINLKGIILGNACTLGAECSNSVQTPIEYSIFQFYQYNDHGFFSFQDWDQFKQNCGDSTMNKFSTIGCIQVQQHLTDKINYDYVDMDNLNGICYHVRQDFDVQNKYKSRNNRHKRSHREQSETPCNYEIGDFYFLNNDTVREALHVDVKVSDLLWTTCTSDTYIYTDTPEGSYHLYPNLIKNNLKIWIYSGDVDGNVPIPGTLNWISQLKKQLNLKELEAWRAWYIPGNKQNEPQVGGMYWDLEGIQFVSVRGAGHEVPFWKPQSASVLIENYLKNTPLPKNRIASSKKMAYPVFKHFQKKPQ